MFLDPANYSAWIIFWNVRYLCFWVRTKNLGSTLHRSIVVEVLLDLLSSMWRTAVGRVNRLSWSGEKWTSLPTRQKLCFLSHATQVKQSTLTLFFLHLHHLPLPLIKGGDILGVFAAHRGICVWGNRGAQVLSHKEQIRAGRDPMDENKLRSLLGLSACGTCWRPGAASWEKPESWVGGWGAR